MLRWQKSFLNRWSLVSARIAGFGVRTLVSYIYACVTTPTIHHAMYVCLWVSMSSNRCWECCYNMRQHRVARAQASLLRPARSSHGPGGSCGHLQGLLRAGGQRPHTGGQSSRQENHLLGPASRIIYSHELKTLKHILLTPRNRLIKDNQNN